MSDSTVSRLRAPTRDGERLVAPAFDAVPRLLDINRRTLDSDTRINGVPLRELRADSRSTLQPIIVSGHQPELFHPGVWAKNFALAMLAERVRGVGVNLVVDHDTLKAPELRVPCVDKVASVPFDHATAETTYESRLVHDAELFASVPQRVQSMANLPWEPLLTRIWPTIVSHTGSIGERFTAARVGVERSWGIENHELPTSRMVTRPAFRHFVQHIHTYLARFREVHNAAVRSYRTRYRLRSRTHPVPELAEGESPFWRIVDGRRVRATVQSPLAELRPRALTLTLFARLILGDLFIHGIGGAKYDEVTDEIIREFFGIEPPAYLTVTATIHLPYPHREPPNLDAIRRHLRDLHWNPQRYMRAGSAEHESLRVLEPSDRRGRRRRFAALREVVQQLRPLVQDHVVETMGELTAAERATTIANVQTRRDYAWVLYPESYLRSAMQDVVR